MALRDLLTEELRNYVTGVTIETAWTPPIVIRDPFQPGAPSPILQALRPRVTVEIRGGAGKPLVMAPYGDPGPSRWPLVVGAGAVLLGLLVYAAWR